ncbi:MAG: 3-phosphoshikimate 1-carboxyvinyltransferase [Rikenellaceae bacterium]
MIQTIKGGAICSGELTPPSSKSYAQRAVAAALLSSGVSTLSSMELCNDTKASLEVAEKLGAKIEKISNSEFKIQGGLAPLSSTLNIGESGLSTRLFTPVASLCNNPITVTGHGSILTRPMTMMITPLEELGVKIESNEGFLPFTVSGPIKGGMCHVDGSASSQLLTGLLTALPLAENDTTLKVNKLTSIPYIDMTIDVLKSFGVKIEHNDYEEFFIKGEQEYVARDYKIEGDWSGASCILVAGAIAGDITLYNMNPLSLQADVAIVDALVKAGAEVSSTPDSIRVTKRELHAFEFDATQCPDLFPALAALAASCKGTTVLKGTKRLTHKESNRAQAIASEYIKMGIEVDISQENIMKITGGKIRGCEIDSHNDHRIAMATAVSALVSEGEMEIHGGECVNKSYPLFWEDLKKISSYE